MLPGSGDPKELGFYFSLSQVGMEMAVPVALGVMVDSYLAWGPWTTILGAVFGLVAGMTHLIVLLNQRNKKQPPHSPSRQEPR
jgi:F0F1-type ATP synthase assembly protein I